MTLETRGRALELLADVELTDAGASFGFKLLHTEHDEEFTLIVFEPIHRRFYVNRSRSSLSASTHRTELQGSIDWRSGDTATVHIFLDHSLLEVFAGYASCLSARIYPLTDESDRVSIFSDNGSVAFKSLRVWSLDTVWSQE